MKDKRIIIILILVLGVATVSIGLATFSSSLNIRSGLTVEGNEDNMNLIISTSSSDPTPVNSISPTYWYLGNSQQKPLTATDAIITKSGNGYTISGIKVNFIGAGRSARYNFYVHNKGMLDVYWKKGIVNNIQSTSSKVKCTAKEGTTDSLVQETCKNIIIDFQYSDSTGLHGSTNNSTNKLIAKDSYLYLGVEISYTNNGVYADGPFDVEFGDVEFTFSTNPN